VWEILCVWRGFLGGGGGGTCVRACVCVCACVHAPFDLPPIA
jgi:hypothetical protein